VGYTRKWCGKYKEQNMTKTGTTPDSWEQMERTRNPQEFRNEPRSPKAWWGSIKVLVPCTSAICVMIILTWLGLIEMTMNEDLVRHLTTFSLA